MESKQMDESAIECDPIITVEVPPDALEEKKHTDDAIEMHTFTDALDSPSLVPTTTTTAIDVEAEAFTFATTVSDLAYANMNCCMKCIYYSNGRDPTIEQDHEFYDEVDDDGNPIAITSTTTTTTTESESDLKEIDIFMEGHISSINGTIHHDESNIGADSSSTMESDSECIKTSQSCQLAVWSGVSAFFMAACTFVLSFRVLTNDDPFSHQTNLIMLETKIADISPAAVLAVSCIVQLVADVWFCFLPREHNMWRSIVVERTNPCRWTVTTVGTAGRLIAMMSLYGEVELGSILLAIVTTGSLLLSRAVYEMECGNVEWSPQYDLTRPKIPNAWFISTVVSWVIVWMQLIMTVIDVGTTNALFMPEMFAVYFDGLMLVCDYQRQHWHKWDTYSRERRTHAYVSYDVITSNCNTISQMCATAAVLLWVR
jgi:hypothetical protein